MLYIFHLLTILLIHSNVSNKINLCRHYFKRNYYPAQKLGFFLFFKQSVLDLWNGINGSNLKIFYKF